MPTARILSFKAPSPGASDLLYLDRYVKEKRKIKETAKRIKAAFNPLKGRKRKDSHKETITGFALSKKLFLKLSTFNSSLTVF